MTTFRLVKLRAYIFTIEQLSIVKAIASKRREYGVFWASDASQMYINMREDSDKLFWWRLVVKSIRYSNDFYRTTSPQKHRY